MSFHSAFAIPRPRRAPLDGARAAIAPVAIALLALVVGCAPLRARQDAAPVSRSAPPRSAEPVRPTLVVHITVDQLRADYYDRWASQMDGGLARLYRGGAVFMNAHQDHAITETAPGHASTLSGRFPRSTGITMNSKGVNDPQATIVGGGAVSGASPFRFRGSTLADWLRIDDPRARALSVSRKDRGAILPIGRLPQDVYWYALDGRFSTSSYYADTLPGWVQAFNARNTAAQWAGRSWTLLLPDSAYAEPDSVPAEAGGKGYLFPHVASSDPARAVRELPSFPWMDDLTADFALAGLEALGLGRGPQTDLLAVSFSTTDAVGHTYGPDSREIHDQILRLDRVLERFLDSLYTLRDSTRVIVSLTADHGVAPMPGTVSHDPNQGARVVTLRPLVAAADSALQRRGAPPRSIDEDGGAITLDRAALRRAGIPADSVVDALAAGARRIPGVRRADPWRSLFAMDTTRDDMARRWLHMFPPDMAPDLVVTLDPYNTWSGSYFQHGVPHVYDTNVPVIFYGPPFRPGRHTDFVRVVDIAPTLAWVLGVEPTEPLDGHVLREALLAPPDDSAPAAAPRRDD